jgi:hypothetical protein
MKKSQTKFASGGMPKVGRLLGRIFQVYMFLANLAIGAVLLMIGPKFAEELSNRVKGETLKMGVIGLIVLFATPIFLLLLLITIIGIPFSIIGSIFFILFLWIANIYGKYSIGSWILEKIERENKWLALITGLLVGLFLGVIPILGSFLQFIILLLGLGALAYSLKVRVR